MRGWEIWERIQVTGSRTVASISWQRGHAMQRGFHLYSVWGGIHVVLNMPHCGRGSMHKGQPREVFICTKLRGLLSAYLQPSPSCLPASPKLLPIFPPSSPSFPPALPFSSTTSCKVIVGEHMVAEDHWGGYWRLLLLSGSRKTVQHLPLTLQQLKGGGLHGLPICWWRISKCCPLRFKLPSSNSW